MATLVELAPAKVNLYLHVLGRRSDGYHELESLAAFASVGDVLRLEPGREFMLTIDGPFATAIDGEDLVAKAVRLAREAAMTAGADFRSGALTLTKNLPVAAGLGGGSADAAATLRLLMRANPVLLHKLDWPGIALRLGADVPVCLKSRAALMTGIGERLQMVTWLPEAAILLANPRVPLPTADMFQALKAAPLNAMPPQPPAPSYRNFDDMIAALAHATNHLESVARALCPPVGDVLAVLAQLPGARLTRMSGSGPTCFALFATLAQAEAAQGALDARRPDWWAAAGMMG